MKKIITRKLISQQITKLINKDISVKDFGEEMFQYLAFDDKYQLEANFEELIKEVLWRFSEMHDAEKSNPGYIPDIPTTKELTEIKKSLDT